jgi:hypothetical protein
MGPCPVCGEPVALYNDTVIGLKDKLHGKADAGDIQALARTVLEFINSQSESADTQEQAVHEERDEGASDSTPRLSPSVRNPDSSPITVEDVEDFLRIDLKLLDKKGSFDRYFR